MTLWRTFRAVLLAPFTVTIVVPAVIALTSGIHPLSDLPGWLTVSSVLVGVVLIALGLCLLTWTVWLFHTVGNGSLAPFDPPAHLVVRGPYRHVRNPMITGVGCILLGEALAFRSTGLLIWAAAFFAVNAIYFPLFEEPGLRRRFGADYEEFCRNVPRWIPRMRPWDQPASSDAA